MERLARESNPAEPVLFVPGLVGLGAPHWVPEARGVIFGLTRATTAADLGRAALEGVAFQVADLIDAAEKDTGGHAGGRRSLPPRSRSMAACRRTTGSCSSRPTCWAGRWPRAAQAESTALGAAFLAAVGSGLTDEKKLAACRRAARRGSTRRCRPPTREETGRVAKSREGGDRVLFGLSS